MARERKQRSPFLILGVTSGVFRSLTPSFNGFRSKLGWKTRVRVSFLPPRRPDKRERVQAEAVGFERRSRSGARAVKGTNLSLCWFSVKKQPLPSPHSWKNQPLKRSFHTGATFTCAFESSFFLSTSARLANFSVCQTGVVNWLNLQAAERPSASSLAWLPVYSLPSIHRGIVLLFLCTMSS